MAKSVRLADIAEKMGVSIVTVSNALSGQKGVSQELRQEIIDTARKMGYKTGSAGSYKKDSGDIGVIIDRKYLDEYTTFYWKFYQQIAVAGTAQKCFTMVEVIDQHQELPKMVQEEKIQGLIVLGEVKPYYLDYLMENVEVPVVLLDFYDTKSRASAVVSDNYYGMYKMTNYLFDQGHREIAYVGTRLANCSITDRYFGYAKSLLEHGVKEKKEWIIDDRDIQSGDIKVELPDKLPSAFVCNCDLTASEVIRLLKERGLRVPEDISIVGFDNYLYPGLCDVEITTYEVDMASMGRKAIREVLDQMNQETCRKDLHTVTGHMVIKDSVLQK